MRLVPDDESAKPSESLDRAFESIRRKINEGLKEAERGEFIDGEEFFARWKSRLEPRYDLGVDSLREHT